MDSQDLQFDAHLLGEISSRKLGRRRLLKLGMSTLGLSTATFGAIETLASIPERLALMQWIFQMVLASRNCNSQSSYQQQNFSLKCAAMQPH